MKIKLPTMKCLRCGHEWFPKKEESPLRCAACKSPYWNKRRQDNSLIDTYQRSLSMKPKPCKEHMWKKDKEGRHCFMCLKKEISPAVRIDPSSDLNQAGNKKQEKLK